MSSCMAVENDTNLRKRTKLDKNWYSAKSPDQISREWAVKSTRAECIFILVRMMFYIGFTTVNRFLKKKLEFTSEFLVFLLFGEV